MLIAKGMVAFLAVAAAVVAPSGFRPEAEPSEASVPVDAEIVRIWARMVWAHAP